MSINSAGWQDVNYKALASFIALGKRYNLYERPINLGYLTASGKANELIINLIGFNGLLENIQ